MLFVGLAWAAPVDLDAAVTRAQEAGLDAQTARLVVDSAERTLRTRKLAGGPDVRFSASAGVGAGAGWSTGAVPAGADLSARLSASMPIYAGGAIRGDVDIAAADLALAQADAAQTRQDLVLALAGALLDLEAARAAVQTREQALAAETAILARVRATVAAGARTKADALQQEAAVAKQQAALVSARRDAAQLELVLEELLRLEDAEFVAPTAAPSVGGPAERPGVKARREALASARRAVDVARASGRPSLDLGLAAGTGWGTGDSATGLVDNASVSAGLDLSVPIWDREVTKGAVVQAELDVRRAELALEDAERAARTDVKQAAVDVEAAEAGLLAAEARVAAATAATTVVQDRYNAGAALITELLSTRAEQVDAETAAAQARVEVVRAGFGAAWAGGGL